MRTRNVTTARASSGATGPSTAGDYIYNNTGPRLARRTDNGGSLSIKCAEHSVMLEQIF